MPKSSRTLSLLTLAFVLMSAGFPDRAPAQMGAVEGKLLSELVPWATFDPSVPTQEVVTGVSPASRPLRHAEVLEYFEALASASPRASLQTYATSHEGRKLLVLAVADEATIANLEAFRREHEERLDPRNRNAASDTAALEGAKAVAWMAYGIHGDELSSTDAAVSLAYWLVAGEDERAQALRDGLLVLIDPMENPDGRDRFLAQTASFAHKTPNPDQDDLSHTTVWPWGRGNHYLFDLNRDWFTMVHPESRRSEVIAGWNPQLVLDCHEMGSDSSYLFSPPREPLNPFLPDYMMSWWDRFASDQGRALDARGYGYFSGEWNEEFFPGYGSTWPSYLGAIGILYEMSGTEGTLVRRMDGTTRTYGEAVEHHLTSSIANLETLAAHRAELLGDYMSARREAVRSPKGPARAWIFPPGGHSDRTDALAHLLRRQGVEVLRAEEAITVSGLHDARTGQVSSREVSAGTWMVPMDQPASPLAGVLLSPHVPMNEVAFREERESIERGEGSRLYDTTAYSLPLLFGIEAYWTAGRPEGAWSATSEPEPRSGAVVIASEVYGYLLDGGSDASVAALADLLQREIKVNIADRPFEVAGIALERGALLIREEGNPADLEQQLASVAERWKVTFHPTPTAQATEGPDLGGSHFIPLRLPKVGVFTGMMVSPSDYGSVWYVLDERAGLRFNGIDLTRAGSLDWSRYNVLVFPPAYRGASLYRRVLGEKGIEKLKGWIEAGGTAVGLGSGAEFLADTETGLTETRLRRQALDEFPPVVYGASAAAVRQAAPMRAIGVTGNEPAAVGTSSMDVRPVLGAGARPFAPATTPAELAPVDLETWLAPLLPAGRDTPSSEDVAAADRRLRDFSPRGAILRADLEPRHWLNWGLGEEMSVLLRASDTLVAGGKVEVAARFADPERLHLGGLLWPEAVGRIAHTAYATREKKGDGQVILFLGHPTFRAWPLESQRMFLNALLYGPGLGTRRSRPW